MQVVDYDPTGPYLVVSGARAGESAETERIDLAPGADLAYTLGPRRCAGVVADGVHYPCDDTAAPRCPAHRSTWVCAKCTGTCLKDEMDCHEDHAVYLAAFAPDVFKVGVTRARRLETRLREQGADRAAHLRTVEDGREARRIEADIAQRVPDRVRVGAKRAGLGRSVDEAAWRDLLAEFDVRETWALDYGLSLAEAPVAETLATGRVRGTKGRLLVLAKAGTTYAVDLRALVGHELRPEATDRDLQSSLSAF